MARGRDRKAQVLCARVAAPIKAAYEDLAGREEKTVSALTGKVLAEWIAAQHPDLLDEAYADAGLTGRRRQGPVETVRVPLYDVRAAAGDGQFISEENLEKDLDLTRRFVSDLGATPESLVGLRVIGDSMAPELVEGDVVLVNTYLDSSATLSEDIYVFRLGEELLIKRLRPLPGGSAEAVSTNAAYPPFVIPADVPEGQFQIVGRLAVRWREPQ